MPLPPPHRRPHRKLLIAAAVLVTFVFVHLLNRPDEVPSEPAIASELGDIIKQQQQQQQSLLSESEHERARTESAEGAVVSAQSVIAELQIEKEESSSSSSSSSLDTSNINTHTEDQQIIIKKLQTSMHSHHSHSGDYVMHAKDHLEEIVQKAVQMGFTTYCLTEHIPRNRLADLYPEESKLTITDLETTFAKFYAHARALQTKYAPQITLLVGFETDYIRADEYSPLIKTLQNTYKFDMFVGSVHHVASLPIDFDAARWTAAMQKAGGTPRALFAAYFDEQYAMLADLRPPVVGHFDLIRLFAPADDTARPIARDWPDVWAKIVRNVEFVIRYGGLFELNSAAIRKGWSEPYPRSDVVQLIMQKGGRFCLSDDSHGLAQVGLNFHKVVKHVSQLGLRELYYLDLDDSGEAVVRKDEVEKLMTDPFWTQYDKLW
ncbi:Polymerase/histidinol phosphatase-like protein [Myxozyma melibiosi]|uniref:histidinol-phosphatase n=1 Tax=Myxozyma melibiosi TaxID=54550 RepID=A0ABR1F0E0_9ASCO